MKTKVEMCQLCGEQYDPRVSRKFEWHHITGRVNSPETILICPTCHDEISLEQNSIAPRLRSQNAPSNIRMAFALRSIGALLKRIGQILINFADSMSGKYDKGGD